MIAALPMYDREENAAAHDRLWARIREALREGGVAAPEALTRDADLWTLWQSPDLLLAQTCGYPYRARLHGRVALVGTPDHGLPDTAPGRYYSVFVARRSDPRRALAAFADARLAYSDALSQSGWAAPQNHAATLGFRFRRTVRTGAHRSSAEAVAAGRADIAALDATSWAMMRRWDRIAEELAEVGRTEPTPALPYITARPDLAGALHAALARAIAALDAGDREALGVHGLTSVGAGDYLAVPTPPGPGQAPGDTPES